MNLLLCGDRPNCISASLHELCACFGIGVSGASAAIQTGVVNTLDTLWCTHLSISRLSWVPYLWQRLTSSVSFCAQCSEEPSHVTSSCCISVPQGWQFLPSIQWWFSGCLAVAKLWHLSRNWIMKFFMFRTLQFLYQHWKLVVSSHLDMTRPLSALCMTSIYTFPVSPVYNDHGLSCAGWLYCSLLNLPSETRILWPGSLDGSFCVFVCCCCSV